MIWTLDAVLKALAALISASVAIVLLRWSLRRPPVAILAAFLLLIAGNQTAETLRALATDDATRLTWYKAASVLAALDPFLLLWGVSKSRWGAALRDSRWIGAALGVGGALALYAGFGLDTISADRHWFAVTLTAYTATVYGAVLFGVMRAATEDAADGGRLVVAAIAVAALPVFLGVPSAVFAAARFDLSRAGYETVALVVDGVFIAGALVATSVFTRTWSASGRRVVLGATIAGIVLWAFLNLFNLTRLAYTLMGGDAHHLRIIGQSAAPVRWLLFSGLLSVVLLRYDNVRLSMRSRRQAARVLIQLTVLTALGVAAAVIQTAGGRASQVRAFEIVVLVLAIGLSQGFRRFVDGIARRVYGADTQDLGPDRVADHPVVRLAPGLTIAGRYRLERRLGSGAAGRVFLARDELLQRNVAVKEVRGSGDGIDEAIREARLGGSLHDPNVVTIFDVIPTRDAVLLVMEYVDGGSLGDKLTRDGPLSAAETVRVLTGVLRGLAAVHARGIVHRDLKPGNILLAPGGVPKIADFGIARSSAITAPLHSGNVGIGTPWYCAPEQARGETPTPAADVFAVGRVAAACTAGARLPPAIEAVIEKAVDPQPERRWPTATAMLDAVLAAHARADASPAEHEQRLPDAHDIPLGERTRIVLPEQAEIE